MVTEMLVSGGSEVLSLLRLVVPALGGLVRHLKVKTASSVCAHLLFWGTMDVVEPIPSLTCALMRCVRQSHALAVTR